MDMDWKIFIAILLYSDTILLGYTLTYGRKKNVIYSVFGKNDKAVCLKSLIFSTHFETFILYS